MNRLDQYSKYAQAAITCWNQQEDAHLRQHPVILPVYTKVRQRLNQAMMHVTRSLHRLVQPMVGRWLVRGVAREWRAVMLPGYDLMMPKGRQLEWVAEQVNLYWQRFAKWSLASRLQDYPMVKEKAVRLLWFGAYRVAATGKLPSHLDAIFAYATLYPLVDEAFDDPNLSKEAKKEMVNGLISELEGKQNNSYYPRSPLFDLCAGQVKAAMNSLPGHQQREMRECLELLAWLEADQTGFDDQLMCTCLKGSLSLIPIYFMAEESIMYEQVFRMGLAMQLVDDLQDAMIDLTMPAPNIFSRAIRNGLSLTPLITKSLNFITAQDYTKQDPLASFVEASMWRMLSYLMTEASFLHGAAIGQPFMLSLHRHLPFPLSLITHYPMEAKLYRLVEILTTEQN